VLLLPWQIWLIVATFLAAVEILSATFVILWFAIGAIMASLAALLGGDLVIQGIVFLLASFLLVLFTKPLAQKFLETKNNEVKTNLEGLEGRTGLVLEEINSTTNKGLVKLGGDIWSAASVDGQRISQGDQIKVVRVEGVKLIVEKL